MCAAARRTKMCGEYAARTGKVRFGTTGNIDQYCRSTSCASTSVFVHETAFKNPDRETLLHRRCGLSFAHAQASASVISRRANLLSCIILGRGDRPADSVGR